MIKVEFEPEVVAKIYTRALARSVNKMVKRAQDLAPVNNSDLKNGIKLKKHNKWSYSIVSTMNYSKAVEFGTSPHWISLKDKNAPLKKWAKRKLGNENLAYAVRNSIAKKGTKRHPFMIPALTEVRNIWVERYIREEANRVMMK